MPTEQILELIEAQDNGSYNIYDDARAVYEAEKRQDKKQPSYDQSFITSHDGKEIADFCVKHAIKDCQSCLEATLSPDILKMIKDYEGRNNA